MEKYKVEADFFKKELDKKDRLIDRCKEQLQHFESINVTRNELLASMESENSYCREQMTLFK